MRKITTKDGNVHWHNAAGELHRTAGTAVEHPDGSREWWPTMASFLENGLISLNDFLQLSVEKPLTNQ